MVRKWEWIAKKLYELNLPDLAIKAEWIDNQLVELYKLKTTPAWRENYKKINKTYNKRENKKKYLADIVLDGDYCTACEYHHGSLIGGCESCKFLKTKHGGCCKEEDDKYDKYLPIIYHKLLRE